MIHEAYMDDPGTIIPFEPDPYYSDEPYEEDFDLSNVYIVLTNDFTNRTEKVEEQWWSGTFEGLKDNMMYTISVMVGDTVIATKMIKTSAERQTSSDDPTNIGGG